MASDYERKSGHVRVPHPEGYLCGDPNCAICELFMCSVCGGAEGSLPTSCPGERMTEEQQDLVFKGDIDFVDGQWIDWRTMSKLASVEG